LLMARVFKRRRGGLPPIVTALIVIAAVAAAGLVAWFMLATTSAAVKQPVLGVTDAYYLPTGTFRLFLTVRNLGASDVTLRFSSINCASGGSFSNGTYSSITIAKGSSAVARFSSASGTIKDGDLCVAPVSITSPTSATITLQFRVIAP